MTAALFSLVLLPFAGALAALAMPNAARRAVAGLAGAVAVGGLALAAWLGPAVLAGEVPAAAIPWMPAIGVDFGFRVDGFAWLFVLLIYGIGALVVLYAAYYLAAEDPPARFFAFLLAFMGAMLGVATADNLVLLVVFWEATSVTSFLLIGYWRGEAGARRGARMALAVTGAGGLALLAGVVILGDIAGSYRLDAVLAAGGAIRADPRYVPALVLVLLGAFTKSAQFPFHFWLPHAMAAPTPVSAYLHSATMVKAGVFLLGRLYPALAGTEEWFWIVSSVGAATLVAGAVLALFQHDLKGLLAYSTISHLGLITLLFGLDTPLSEVAAVFHILNHAVFKASLFMAAGIIDHETGTRDMRRLNGLWAAMPVTGTLAMVAAGAMAGVPLANGFLSKEMFFAETLAIEGHGLLGFATPLLAVAAGTFSVAYSLRFIHDVFFNGDASGLPRAPHEPPRWMRVPVEILVLACLAVGLAPGYTVAPLLEVGARAVLGRELPGYSLALWHGFNAPLAMSALALAAGVGLYFALQKRVNLHLLGHVPDLGKAVFDRALAALDALAARAGAFTAAMGVQGSLAWFTGAALLLALWPWLGNARVSLEVPLTGLPLPAVVVWGIGVAGAVGTVAVHRNRLAALLLLGATGLVVAMAFVALSAPDLALTQMLVEVVTIVLMMLALHYLPARAPAERNAGRKARDLVLALVAGAGMAGLTLAVLGRPSPSISPFYLDKALTEGGGTNAVNVIIVDFRALDTLGEITVLGIAALVVHALLKGVAVLPPAERREATGEAHPMLPRLVARVLLPVAALAAMHLLLRGHDLPGGGFIAGLVLAVAIALQYVTSGAGPIGESLRERWDAWIGWGLLAAGATGLASLAFSHPFLTSTFWKPEVPVVGKVPLASAMAFDVGVFLTVVGATLLALATLGRLRARDAAAGEG
jgi:multicomponent K+:H+ antiporter subunit A